MRLDALVEHGKTADAGGAGPTDQPKEVPPNRQAGFSTGLVAIRFNRLVDDTREFVRRV